VLADNDTLDAELAISFDSEGSLGEEDQGTQKEGQGASRVLESAQRSSLLQATSSLPSLRRELMDIRELLSN
jgi:hypothetical protein